MPFILFFIVVSVLGQFINNHTTNMSGSGANPNQMGQGQQQPYYTYQQQAAAQQPRMQKQKQQGNDDVAPPGSEQTHWFQGNQNNAGNEKSHYSSYGDYDHALDDRTKQIDKESKEQGGKGQYHY